MGLEARGSWLVWLSLSASKWSSELLTPLLNPLHDPCFPSLSPLACRDPPPQRHDITHALSVSFKTQIQLRTPPFSFSKQLY